MKQLFLPAILFMNRLKYGGKFVIVSGIFLIPLAVLGYGYLTQVLSSIEKSKQEIVALELFPTIHKLYQVNQDYIIEAMIAQRDLSQDQLKKRNNKLNSALELLKQLQNSDNPFSANQNFQQQLASTAKALNESQSISADMRAPANERYLGLANTRAEILQLFRVISNESGIINDPELKTFYLGQLLNENLYKFLEPLQRAQAIGYFGLSSSPIDPGLFDEMSGILDRTINQNIVLKKDNQYLISISKDLGALKSLLDQQNQAYESIINYIDEQFFIAVDIEVTSQDFYARLEEAKKPFETTFTDGHQLLLKLYNDRISREENAFWSLVLIVLVALLFAGYLFIGMSLSIGMSVGTLIKTAEKFASGDLEARARFETKDEMNSLKQSINWMMKKVGALLKTIENSSDLVSSQAEKVETIAKQTGDVIHQQSTTIEQIVSATNQLIESVNEISMNTNSVQSAVDESNKQMMTSTEIMERAKKSSDELTQEIKTSVYVIDKLAEQSNSISQVLDVIKNIAEQTNLLALNAAIEAARAGEQGRGFAVVADEVRTLASRTQQSTQEIEQTIEALHKGVEEAVNSMTSSSEKTSKTAEESSQIQQAIDQIQSAVQQIANRNQDTQNSSASQQEYANQIERLLNEIKDISTSTARYSKDTIDAGLEMTQLAANMRKMVDEFHHSG
ncbi:MAG: methyl-accepting chemotaxis protein [Gammaproteobacteria bacterium]|nr:methyl-accepting chemotaxis protein [Gammaproteobacteria bacterium]